MGDEFEGHFQDIDEEAAVRVRRSGCHPSIARSRKAIRRARDVALQGTRTRVDSYKVERAAAEQYTRIAEAAEGIARRRLARAPEYAVLRVPVSQRRAPRARSARGRRTRSSSRAGPRSDDDHEPDAGEHHPGRSDPGLRRPALGHRPRRGGDV